MTIVPNYVDLLAKWLQWHEIAEPKAIPQHFLAHSEADRLFENRTVEGEGVKFPVFSSRVNILWKRCDKLFINSPTTEFTTNFFGSQVVMIALNPSLINDSTSSRESRFQMGNNPFIPTFARFAHGNL